MMAEVVASRLLRRNIVGGRRSIVADGLVDEEGAPGVIPFVESRLD